MEPVELQQYHGHVDDSKIPKKNSGFKLKYLQKQCPVCGNHINADHEQFVLENGVVMRPLVRKHQPIAWVCTHGQMENNKND